MTDILVQPAELRQIAGRFRTHADKIRKSMETIDATILALKGDRFMGNRASLVQSHYQSKRDALLMANSLILHFATELETAANVFENADRSGSQTTPGNTSPGGTLPSFVIPQWMTDLLKNVEDGGEILGDMLLVAALKNGSTFAGQVKIFGPEWYSKYILGLPENLRSIKGANLLDKVSKSPLGDALTMVKLVADIVPDMFKYTDTTHRLSAIAIDALITAGTLGAADLGMEGGAIIGTAICPGVGTVIGGLAGGFLAGWVTDHVLTTPFSTLIPEAGTFAGGEIGNMIIPGIGGIPGAYYGGEVGNYISGLISPQITQFSIKDYAVEGINDFTTGTGEFIGHQIYGTNTL